MQENHTQTGHAPVANQKPHIGLWTWVYIVATLALGIYLLIRSMSTASDKPVVEQRGVTVVTPASVR